MCVFEVLPQPVIPMQSPSVTASTQIPDHESALGLFSIIFLALIAKDTQIALSEWHKLIRVNPVKNYKFVP
jgi:hypothetical protein